MIVEITGSTGVGKSTVSFMLKDLLQKKGVSSELAHEYVLRRYCMIRLSSQLLDTIFFDVLTSSFVILNLHKCFVLVFLSIYYSLRYGDTLFFKINILRNVIKKIGLFYCLKKNNDQNKIFILDEGPLHCVHNLFVHVGNLPDLKHMFIYIDHLPRCDLVALLYSNLETLFVRTSARGGHRRVKDKNDENTKTFLRNSIEVFSALKKHEGLADNLFALENESSAYAAESLANRITGILRTGDVITL